jgi:hypothetical protein
VSVPASPKPNDRKSLGAVLAIAAGGLLILGAALPWITMGSPLVGTMANRSGLAGEDGLIFLVGGLILAALGLCALSGHPSTVPGLLIAGGLAAASGALLEYRDMAQAITGVANDASYSLGVGVGIWFLFAGGLLCVVAGIVLWGQTEPVAATTTAGARWRQLGEVAAMAPVVLLLVVMINANANNKGDWWSHDGFSWCEERDSFCERGLVVAAT